MFITVFFLKKLNSYEIIVERIAAEHIIYTPCF